jgi:phosphoribosylaminoimidazole-succinocarboxamide synthase
MATPIPQDVANSSLREIILKAGLTSLHQGKVRDTYALPDEDLMLVVATDRVSIFDFVLNCTIGAKGEILAALTVFWLTEILNGQVDHHLIAYGRNIDTYLPDDLEGMEELQRRALVVRKLKMLPVECIVRGYLTGSGLKSYKAEQQVCGIRLPTGLHDGSQLPEPIFTPTTKAEVGHDEHLDARSVANTYGTDLGEASIRIYKTLAQYASGCGVILADTKFEFGQGLVLADEVGTPDSSRFWDRQEWEGAVADAKSPSPYDKQLVRDWGKTVQTPFGVDGIDSLKPENLDHVRFIHEQVVPLSVQSETASRYHTVFERLVRNTLEGFQASKMGIEH